MTNFDYRMCPDCSGAHFLPSHRRMPRRSSGPLENESQRAFRRRHGRAHPDARLGPQARLERVNVKQGTLSSEQLDLLAKIQSTKFIEYAGRSTIGGTPRRLLHTPAEGYFHDLLATFDLSVYAVEAKDEPWLLGNAGPCGDHIDTSETCKVSLLICLHTDHPYEMHISSNVEKPPLFYRPITMKSGTWITFPSNVFHKCVAEETNKRLILNSVCNKM